MISTNQYLSIDVQCPVVGRMVFLDGVCMVLSDDTGTAVTRNSCSHAADCVAVHGSLDSIPECVLRRPTFRGKKPGGTCLTGNVSHNRRQ